MTLGVGDRKLLGFGRSVKPISLPLSFVVIERLNDVVPPVNLLDQLMLLLLENFNIELELWEWILDDLAAVFLERLELLLPEPGVLNLEARDFAFQSHNRLEYLIHALDLVFHPVLALPGPSELLVGIGFALQDLLLVADVPLGPH